MCVCVIPAIYLHIYGVAKSEWGEQHGNYRHYYKGKEVYLSVRIFFFGAENGKNNC